MNGLNTNNSPHWSVVVPHFVFGAICLLFLSVLIVLADTNLLAEYFNSKIIAITHMAVLGWATMIVFGALYQLIPVVFETSLYSEKLAKITFLVSAISVLFLTYAFWVGAFTNLLLYASASMFISLLLFVINIVLTYQKSTLKNIKSIFIITAIFWLGFTELLGTLVAFNFSYNFLPEIHLHYLKIHATIGLIGWFLMLIIGVGSTLIPMFLISHELKESKIVKAYYLINIGLLGLLLNWFLMNIEAITMISAILIVVGILFFISFIYDSYKKRLRKKLDIGMKYSMLAIAIPFAPILIVGLLFFSFNIETDLLFRITTFYGFSIIFGFITTLILGQTYKTLPFIIWLHKYQKLVGKIKTPLPRELYSEKIATIQFFTYLSFLIFMMLGFIFNNILAIRIGSFLLLLVAILYNINIIKIITHKVKST